MKKIIVFPILMTIFALANTSCSYAALAQRSEVLKKKITLPSAEVLKTRIEKEIINSDFLEITKLDKEFVGRELDPSGIVRVIDLALYDYRVSVKNPALAKLVMMTRPHIIAAILQDYPEVILELEAEGILKP